MNPILGFLLFPVFIISLFMLEIQSPILLSLIMVFLSFALAIQFVAMVNYWTMFVIILVFTGGMMILMVYVSSLASSDRNYRLKNFLSGSFMFFLFLVSGTDVGSENMLSLFVPSGAILMGFMLALLLFGLFVIILLLNKTRGALR